MKFYNIFLSGILSSSFPIHADTNSSNSPNFYETCTHIRLNENISIDGNYTIDPDGNGNNEPFEVYCYGMNSVEPKEFLNLVKTGTGYNYSMYKAGGARIGTDVFSNYTKIRIDPDTLELIPDTTFSESSGEIFCPDSNICITSAEYGKAADCIAFDSMQGKANINLEGTPFYIHNDLLFKPTGFHPNGQSYFSTNRQIADITGGGHCGSNTPYLNEEAGLFVSFLQNYVYTSREAKKPQISIKGGFIKLDTLSGRSPINSDCSRENHYGRQVYDEVNGILYICSHSGWLPH